ncbi:quinone oxidoreductase [uncultured Jatrophihabitans sp.]|uniref:quinone oxidoreductase family protein n=1 Tax=uncultured Jatrophihabitans sp. TaxID=1610747 RepID=UPI0035CBB6F6
MTDDMQALVVTRTGGIDVLEVQRRPVPEPAPGQLLVQVAASGVNFKDVYLREGVYPSAPPFVPGEECAGTVLAVGADVEGFAVGDVVASASAIGAHAEQALVPARHAIAIPSGLDPQIAAAAMLQGMTAHYLVHSTYAVREGDDVLVHAAAGGVGQLLVQLVKRQGAHVVATVGSDAKVQVARAAGADAVIRYDEAGDLAAAVREHVPDGVHVVYDGVGKATFEASLASLRRRGMLALFGAASGQVPPFDLQRLNPAGSLFVTRPTLADYVATRDELQWRAGDVLDGAASGELRIAIGGRYPLDDAQQCYRDLEGRRTTGKLLIVP